MVHAVPNCGFARAYVVSGKDGLMVIDAGSAGTAEDLSAFIKSQPGMSTDMVKYITATHFHVDHIGGIGPFLAECPATTKVMFHPLVRSYLAGEKRISLVGGWNIGLIPAAILSLRYVNKISHCRVKGLAGIPVPGMRLLVHVPYDEGRIGYFGSPAVKTESTVSEERKKNPAIGEGPLPSEFKRYHLGFDQWEVIETPGHTEDSISLFDLESEALICGDLIVNMGRNRTGKLNPFCWDKKTTVQTYEFLCSTLSPKIIYPGHGEPIQDRDNALLKVKLFRN